MDALIAPPILLPARSWFNSNLYPYPAGELHGEARLCNVKANWPMAKLSDFSQTFAVQASRDVM